MSNNSRQDAHYHDAVERYGASLQRIARSTEANRQRQADLLQDMHVGLWQSFARYDSRCTLSTWVYRVAHNAAATYVYREKRHRARAMMPDELEQLPDTSNLVKLAERNDGLEQLHAWIRRLNLIDRQVLTLYLEELDAQAISEIVGLSPGAVATRISRLKTKLANDFKEAQT